MTEARPLEEDLFRAAARVREAAHAPYSHFRVGAALETISGRVFVGCNVENASYGLTVCAERNAVAAALAAGERHFRRIVIVTDDRLPTPPCGACRQVLAEFSEELEVLSSAGGLEQRWMLSELLPARFLFPPPGGEREARVHGGDASPANEEGNG